MVAHGERSVGLIVDSAREFVTILPNRCSAPESMADEWKLCQWNCNGERSRHPDSRRVGDPNSPRDCTRSPQALSNTVESLIESNILERLPENEMAVNMNTDIRRLREETDGITTVADAIVEVTAQLLNGTKVQMQSLESAKNLRMRLPLRSSKRPTWPRMCRNPHRNSPPPSTRWRRRSSR